MSLQKEDTSSHNVCNTEKKEEQLSLSQEALKPVEGLCHVALLPGKWKKLESTISCCHCSNKKRQRPIPGASFSCKLYQWYLIHILFKNSLSANSSGKMSCRLPVRGLSENSTVALHPLDDRSTCGRMYSELLRLKDFGEPGGKIESS